jgi:hypothetical protein
VVQGEAEPEPEREGEGEVVPLRLSVWDAEVDGAVLEEEKARPVARCEAEALGQPVLECDARGEVEPEPLRDAVDDPPTLRDGVALTVLDQEALGLPEKDAFAEGESPADFVLE